MQNAVCTQLDLEFLFQELAKEKKKLRKYRQQCETLTSELP
jgi:hypothetical protein